jgi:hypothetical protein
MNPIKKILVDFKKTRSIYDPKNMIFNRKYNPSTQKEDMRQARRLQKINRFDDEETGEPPIEALTTNKAKLVFKMLTEAHNSHRLSRKEMPKEEKAEYIKKCKEFSLYKTNQWRHQFVEMNKCLKAESDMLNIACLLPMYLVDEVMDLDEVNDEMDDEGEEKRGSFKKGDESDEEETPKVGKNDWMKGYEKPVEIEHHFIENSENVEALEYTPEFLHLPQVMRIYPDDYHIVYKTLLNMPAYETSKTSGIDEQGDSLVGGGNEES